MFAWSVDRGLPSDKIRDLTQTRDGYLWIATAQGLARFDGARFTNFTSVSNPELRGGGFFAVCETPDGTLWAGGDQGLFRWNHGRFDHYTTVDGLSDNYIRALAVAADGSLVVCTRAGFNRVHDGRVVAAPREWQETRGVARAFLPLPDGAVLLGTDDGLWRAQNGRVDRLSGRDGLSSRGFLALARAPDGSVWIGHSQGVRRIRPDGVPEDYGRAQGLPNPRIAALAPDRDGNVWIGTPDGLFRWAAGKIEPAVYPVSGLAGATLQQFFEDRDGAFWIAAATGLYRLEDNDAGSIGREDGLEQTSVYSVYEASDGTWWIGLWNGGVYRYDQHRATPVSGGPDGPEQVLALAESPAGTMWIGAVSGLYRVRGDAVENLYDRTRADAWGRAIAQSPAAIIPGIAQRRSNAIAPDGSGGVWVGTDNGLYHSAPGGFQVFTSANGLLGNVVKSVCVRRNGEVWVSTPPYGVAWRHDGVWSTLRAGRELSPVFPRAIHEDRQGDLWITTDGGGVNWRHEGRWRTLTAADGLADDFIASVIDDAAGNIWLAFPRGVMRLTREELDAFWRTGVRLEPRILGRSDGLPAGEANQQGSPSAWRARDGRLLFATDRGVGVVEPSRLSHTRRDLPVYVERMVVNGADADLGRAVRIAPGANNVEIHYTAISTLAPENVRFRIRLAPLDPGWVDTGAQRSVRYAQLPPGEYEFSVTATDTLGQWGHAVRRVGFTVQPSFFQTRWFTRGGPLLASVLLAGAFFARSRMARRRVAKLEKVVDQRTRALREATEAAEAAVVAKTEVISALEKAQAETANERARFKFIFDAVPIGLRWRIAEQPESAVVNAAFLQITGVGVAEAGQDGALRGAAHVNDRAALAECQDALAAGRIDHFTTELRCVHPDGTVRWAFLAVHAFRGRGHRGEEIMSLVDVTERKDAEAKLAESSRQLVEFSRHAGMAEIATGVLHNVGNVLNSVNVSVSLLANRARTSRADRVGKVGALLRENAEQLGEFMTRDPRGRRIPEFLDALAQNLSAEQQDMLKELESLETNVSHIKEIVAIQQNYAKVGGVLENAPVAEMVEQAIRMNATALQRHGVRVRRDYRAEPTIITDRHRVLQILVNLIQNAKFACQEAGQADRSIEVSVDLSPDGVRIAVTDNGVGIPAENLTRIFGHGFTTRKNGHGFGLHSGALAARELGGSLTVHSAGPGQGATFTLELPLAAPRDTA